MSAHNSLEDRCRLRKLFSGLGVLVLTFALSVMLPTSVANAAVVRAFTPYFSTQTNGAITITGNALLSCPTTDANCVAAQTSANATKGNNDFVMQPLDADADASTRNSSAANVEIPAGSRVLYAGLFWGAATTAVTGRRWPGWW